MDLLRITFNAHHHNHQDASHYHAWLDNKATLGLKNVHKNHGPTGSNGCCYCYYLAEVGDEEEMQVLQ